MVSVFRWLRRLDLCVSFKTNVCFKEILRVPGATSIKLGQYLALTKTKKSKSKLYKNQKKWPGSAD